MINLYYWFKFINYTLTLGQSADDGSAYVQSSSDLKKQSNEKASGHGGKQLNK